MNKKTTKENSASPKKPKALVCPVTKAKKVKLVSYTMKAMIRIGEYESIEPEVTVEAETIKEAHDFVFGYISDLRRGYSINVERVTVTGTPMPTPTPTPIQVQLPLGNSTASQTNADVVTLHSTTPQGKNSPAFDKAKQAVMSCLTPEALNLIAEQIHKSVKLNDVEKSTLLEIATAKTEEFNGTDK